MGATTLDEYRVMEKDAALARRFQSVYVKEPDVEDTLSILRGLKVGQCNGLVYGVLFAKDHGSKNNYPGQI